jgi:tetratricopeptide (TPR) repeat protein
MIRHHDIPWFNPRQMDDATVRALSTGREDLVRDFFLAARQRLREPSAGKHWLVLGPRGAGKSFFLRLVQCRFAEAMNLEGKTASIVLLPEEQPNVFSPHEWLQEVQRLLPGQIRSKGQSPVWQVKDEAHAWQTALESLLDTFKGDLLVIAVENFDQLLNQAFDNDVRASRLRNLMENEPRIMLLASAVEGEFDEVYEKRLFRQFEHHPMPRWDERDHRDYLTRRAKLQDKEPTNRQLAKIDAYSRFTGGSARTAAVLAASILDEQDPLSASHDLIATLDRMSDYYRALIEKMPPNTRKIFDNLVRGGEPASQVELASRIQARQSDISKAFRWLTDYGYVINEKQPGSKEHSYRVSDRLFVQFYRMRYIDPDQPCQLAILADLLAATIEFSNKWQFAESYLGMEKHAEAELMARLACEERGVDVRLLPEGMRKIESLVALGKEWAWMDRISKHTNPVGYVSEMLNRFDDEEGFKVAYTQTYTIAKASAQRRDEALLITERIHDDLSLTPVEKAAMFSVIAYSWSSSDWAEIAHSFMRMLDHMSSIKSEFHDWFASKAEKADAFPLAFSLEFSARKALSSLEESRTHSLQEATIWAARSINLWLRNDQVDQAAEAVEVFSLGLRQLLNEQMSSDALKAAQIIEPMSSKLSEEQQALLLVQLGDCYGSMQRYSDARESYRKAHSMALKLKHNKEATSLLEFEAHYLALDSRLTESIELLRRATSERLSRQELELSAINIGQIARHRSHLESLDSAVEELLAAKLDPKLSVVAFAQLGELVWDHFQASGATAAFSVGCDVLRHSHSSDPVWQLTAVLGMWVEMTSSGIPTSLLRDLLNEMPTVLATSSFLITKLCHTLEAWLDYLSTSPDQREQQLKRLDPDLASTIIGLCESLNPKARHRYGLIQSTAEN